MAIWNSNYRENRGPRFQVLCKEQLDEIHAATLEVMERTGSRIFDDGALALLKKAGAHISDGNRVRISPGLVEKALGTVPHRVVLCDREGKRVMPLEGHKTFFGTGSDCLYALDPRTGQRRQAVLQDIVDGMRLCEAMPNIDYVMCMFMPWDVPGPLTDHYQMETMLLYTHKPVVFVTVDLERCVDLVEMAEAVAGGADELRLRPQIACYNNVAAPLRHNHESVQKLLYLAGKGLPQLYVPGSLRGVTAPITIAGALVVSNACQLTGLVLTQLKQEGAPFIRGFGGSTMDMRTMVNLYAEPERSRANTDLAHYYDLPVFGIAGCADSKVLDEQAAIEAALTLLMDALSGTNLVHDVGYLEAGLMGSLESVVLCDEVIGWVKRHMAAVEVNPEALAVDLIDQVGPDGTFLDTDHTMRHFREDWYPRFMDRHNYADWEARGKPSMIAKISDHVAGILSTPAEPVLSPDVAGQVRAVRQRAEARLAETQA